MKNKLLFFMLILLALHATYAQKDFTNYVDPTIGGYGFLLKVTRPNIHLNYKKEIIHHPDICNYSVLSALGKTNQTFSPSRPGKKLFLLSTDNRIRWRSEVERALVALPDFKSGAPG